MLTTGFTDNDSDRDRSGTPLEEIMVFYKEKLKIGLFYDREKEVTDIIEKLNSKTESLKKLLSQPGISPELRKLANSKIETLDKAKDNLLDKHKGMLEFDDEEIEAIAKQEAEKLQQQEDAQMEGFLQLSSYDEDSASEPDESPRFNI